MLNIAINGFGRIGRNLLRILFERKMESCVIAINDVAEAETLAHLFKYDSVHGVFSGSVQATKNELIINGKTILILSEKQPEKLSWKALAIDLVIESTGKFVQKSQAEKHLLAGANQVLLSAPSPDKEIPTVIIGINEAIIDLGAPILSNASCTTNNIAPLIKILDEHWGISDGYITTIHSMTGDQNLHDAPHKDLRRARAASRSIIPTTTGAAKAITNVFPHLEGKLGGAGIRVPVLNGSLTDFTCNLMKPATVSEINRAFKFAAEHELKKVLSYTEDPIVSIDVNNSPYSCVFDALLTSVVGGLVKVVGWYDNEMGYSNRLADLIALKISKCTSHGN